MIEKIDNLIKPLLQKNVVFCFKRKNYKTGKLLLYKVAGNYMSFTLITEKKKETFEIPFPFSVNADNQNINFDYRLETLAENDYELLITLKSITKIKNCRFYDNILTITAL